MSTKKVNGSSGKADVTVYDLVCGGELGPGVLPADVALYLLGQVGRRTLKGGSVRFSGKALDGVCELERELFAEVAAAMGADNASVEIEAEPDGTAVVEYDLTRLEPQVWDGEKIRAVAVADRPFVSIGHLGKPEGPALDAVKHVLGGREIYYDCKFFGVSPELAAEIGLGGEHRPGPPERTELEFAAVVTNFGAGKPLTDSGKEVYVGSAATVAATMLTGRLEDPARLFKKKGRR
jgi:hypothetical protein